MELALPCTFYLGASLHRGGFERKHEQPVRSLFWRQVGKAKNHNVATVAGPPCQHDYARAIEVPPETETALVESSLVGPNNCATAGVDWCGNTNGFRADTS